MPTLGGALVADVHRTLDAASPGLPVLLQCRWPASCVNAQMTTGDQLG